MTDIPIVLAIFICTPDALHCIDVSDHRFHADPPACEQSADLLRDRLRDETGGGALIFTKCRYVLPTSASIAELLGMRPGS